MNCGHLWGSKATQRLGETTVPRRRRFGSPMPLIPHHLSVTNVNVRPLVWPELLVAACRSGIVRYPGRCGETATAPMSYPLLQSVYEEEERIPDEHLRRIPDEHLRFDGMTVDNGHA